jgi:hypothetical protein
LPPLGCKASLTCSSSFCLAMPVVMQAAIRYKMDRHCTGWTPDVM